MNTAFTDIYQTVTAQIITALEAGTPPWICPWTGNPVSAAPANLSTGRPYRGINTLLLNLQSMARGYPLNRWITFQQARQVGACVRRGETGTPIVFFNMFDVAGAKSSGRHAANDASSRKVIPLLRSFTVFNAAQVEDLPDSLTALPPVPEGWNPVSAAAAIMARSEATIRHGGDRAFYRPSDDAIQLPPASAFSVADDYYSTALHELTHSTAHPSRCNRVLSGRQHIQPYAFEELVAEMGSAFLCSHCGIAGQLQHASYIAHWLEALRNDKRLIFTAASLAQKAADYLIGVQDMLPGTEQAVVPSAELEVA